jgi:THAP4-like, heme-binding beta-barrel domain
MVELTARGSTSLGTTRLGRPASLIAEELGSLADLVGTWFGTHGWEMIAVPRGEKQFLLIVRPYAEVITFATLGAPVPNRGAVEPDIDIGGLIYDMRISDLETNEPLHLENGMWLDLGATQSPRIARMAAIPHGDTFLALGDMSVDAVAEGAQDGAQARPTIPKISGLPITGEGMPPGYTDQYLHPSVKGFSPVSPNTVLEEDLGNLKVVKTVTLSVSTQTATGGILNIPFVTKNANTTAFQATYWIETVEVAKKDPSGKVIGTEHVQQLQYSQQSNLEFFKRPDGHGLIMWPHVNVNTLRKQ